MKARDATKAVNKEDDYFFGVANWHRNRRQPKHLVWKPACPLQRSPRPSGPEMPTKSRECLRDLKKSQKSLGESPASLRRVSGKCLESVFGVFRDFFETFWGRGRETFSRLFRHFGPGGHGRPL